MQELEQRIKLGNFNTIRPKDKRIKLESIVSISYEYLAKIKSKNNIGLDS